MHRVRISIVTPSYQQASFLEETLASVAAQTGVEVEHMVVDGGSTDGSLAIIERHAQRLAWWCSERDSGQSEAINKGLSHCTGQVFNWLNSDDVLLPGALRTVCDAFQAEPDLQVFGGRIVHRDAAGDRVFERLNDARDELRLFADPVINQPATFYRTDVVKAIGGVDPMLRYVMDVELWWQFLFRYGTAHVRFEPVELTVFRLHEASKTVSHHSGFLNELATLLHGMCARTGQHDLASVFEAGHDLVRGLRGVPVREEHRARVRAMAVHFLLKWYGNVHDERQFRMMKLMKRTVRIDEVPGVDEHVAARWERLSELGTVPNWLGFRIRRKWRDLRR